jgi:hypothetical protein
VITMIERSDMCTCGHPQSTHRTYGCTAWTPNPDPKKTERVWCQCKAFQSRKVQKAAAGEWSWQKPC